MTSDKASPPVSIRRRLLTLLIGPIIVVLLAGAGIDYLSGFSPVRDAYDQSLADAALAVAGSVRTDASGHLSATLPPEALMVLRTDALDSIYFRIAAPDGSVIDGDRDLPQALNGGINPSFQTALYQGTPIRMVNYRSVTEHGVVTTTVAETMNKRARFRTRFWSTVVSADVIELLAILALIWTAVTVALGPLQALHDQIAGRSARDLAPLRTEFAPLEVNALVQGLNRLFSTVTENARMQRQFLESAAHQLRTPLAGVHGQLELLISEETETAKRERLALALSATQRLSRTTQQLLALARSEHATFGRIEFAWVDLSAVSERCIAEHFSDAIRAEVDLGADLHPAFVSGISWLLSEAINNLVDNAIAYSPPGGLVTVRCGSNSGAEFIEVVDSGVGIPFEEQQRVTDRFFRGRMSRGVGSGLGLAIVADVARLHAAVLSISSGEDDRGTRVRIEFRSPSQDAVQ